MINTILNMSPITFGTMLGIYATPVVALCVQPTCVLCCGVWCHMLCYALHSHHDPYTGDNLLSSRCLLFKSLHKVKWFVDFLARGQNIGRYVGAAAGMDDEVHFTEEDAVMPGGGAGEDIVA